MTAYCVTNNSAPGYLTLAITAGLYEVKIQRVDLVDVVPGGGTSSYLVRMIRSTGSSTGGTAASIYPMRQGAPAASAAAVSGTTLTIAGASSLIADLAQVAHAQNVTGTGGGTGSYPSGSSLSYSFPVGVTVAPGGSFRIDNLYGPDSSGFADYGTIYFEELRPPWGY